LKSKVGVKRLCTGDTNRFLDVIRNFILFLNDAKILSADHHYYGMIKAARKTSTSSHCGES
jgi:type I restriction enzyme R subunit